MTERAGAPNFDFEEHRRQWREVPGGPDRISTSELNDLSDKELEAIWDVRWDGQRLPIDSAFYYTLYTEFMRGKRVLELGSGLGFDGIHFTGSGADWTFCDIAEGNLELVGRVFRLKYPAKPFKSHYIDCFESFDRLDGQFDVIWANGSLLTIPFELAREESLQVIPLLRPGGRWIELAYPRSRWEREGALPFSDWGGMTDGPGKPWMEWYELPKLLRRLKPAPFIPLLAFNFLSDTVNWFDLLLDTKTPLSKAALHAAKTSSVQVPLAPTELDQSAALELTSDGAMSLQTEAGIWSFLAALPLNAAQDWIAGEGGDLSVEIECEIKTGTVGFAIVGEALEDMNCFELFLSARPGIQIATVRATRLDRVGQLMIRNGGIKPVSCIIRSIQLEYQPVLRSV